MWNAHTFSHFIDVVTFRVRKHAFLVFPSPLCSLQSEFRYSRPLSCLWEFLCRRYLHMQSPSFFLAHVASLQRCGENESRRGLLFLSCLDSGLFKAFFVPFPLSLPLCHLHVRPISARIVSTESNWRINSCQKFRAADATSPLHSTLVTRSCFRNSLQRWLVASLHYTPNNLEC